MANKISIDQKECLGCGLCASGMPELFEVDEKDFKASVKGTGELSAEQLDQTANIVKECPTQAIKLSE